MMTEEQAKEWIEARWGCAAVLKLDQFVALLRVENMVQNLVSAASLEAVWLRHLADSAQLVSLAGDAGEGAWLDIGTGAGFPGLVAAILQPDQLVHLVEPRKRRAEWLARASQALSLSNATVHASKVEQITPFPAAIISARAVAALDRLTLWAQPFSTKDTLWLLPKGRNGRQELAEANVANRRMFHVKQSMTDEDAVILVGKGKAGKQ